MDYVRNRGQSNASLGYNFRQTREYPENDGQNGFEIIPASGVKAHDIIVSAEPGLLSDPMCPGVGHNDIDECPNLQNEVDRLIKKAIMGDIGSIMSLLLLD